MNKYRTHNCSELNEKDKDKKVTLSGWVHRKRDHGNLLFIDIRDHYGLTQCVIENKSKYFFFVRKNKARVRNYCCWKSSVKGEGNGKF